MAEAQKEELRECELCGSPVEERDEAAEMYDASKPWPSDSYFCHAQCGIERGMQVA